LLHRGRGTVEVPAVALSIEDRHVAVTFPPVWLEHNPLTHADIQDERDILARADIVLSAE
jgi:exopolyphosphatase/guanosine-5'-triphosphate,3'-diphosphate pyrophosphatase